MNLKILSYKEIKEISSDCNVIPVCKPILADIETPVSIWKSSIPLKSTRFYWKVFPVVKLWPGTLSWG